MNNIKKFRTELGLTLEELALRSGTIKSWIWELENGRCASSPGLKKAYAISKALNKSVYDVFPDDQTYSEETIVIKKIVKTA